MKGVLKDRPFLQLTRRQKRIAELMSKSLDSKIRRGGDFERGIWFLTPKQKALAGLMANAFNSYFNNDNRRQRGSVYVDIELDLKNWQKHIAKLMYIQFENLEAVDRKKEWNLKKRHGVKWQEQKRLLAIKAKLLFIMKKHRLGRYSTARPHKREIKRRDDKCYEGSKMTLKTNIDALTLTRKLKRLLQRLDDDRKYNDIKNRTIDIHYSDLHTLITMVTALETLLAPKPFPPKYTGPR